MMYWALIFAFMAVVTGLFGIGVATGASIGLAEIVLWIVVVFVVLSSLSRLMRRVR